MALGACRECGKEVSTEAKSCPHCGAVKPMKKGISTLSAVMLILIGLIFVGSIAPRLFGPAVPPSVSVPPITTASATTVKEAPKDGDLKVESTEPEVEKSAKQANQLKTASGVDAGNWTYDTNTDQMTGKRQHYAGVQADGTLSFDFPYSGGSTAHLTLRKAPRSGVNVMLGVSKGHFLCSSYDGCSVTVRFDENSPIKFHADEPSSHSTTVLFISPEEKFVAGLKKAKTTRIEAEFYQQGKRVMTFNTANLKWPPKE